MIPPERLAKIVAHAKRHEDEDFKDNDVSVLLAEREKLKSGLEYIRDLCDGDDVSASNVSIEEIRDAARKALE